MKKLNRSQKSKVIEIAKTITIVLLFSLCIFLGYRILQLYKEQTNVEDALWGSMGGSAEIMESGGNSELKVFSDSPYPYMIAANSASARRLIDAKSQMFEDLSSLTNELIVEAYAAKSENVTVVQMQEFNNALATDSIYIRYSAPRILNIEAELYGIKPVGLWNRIKSFDRAVIVLDNDRDSDAALLVYDCDSERVVKVKLSGDMLKALGRKTQKIDIDEEKGYIFAWELNLDKKDKDGIAALDSTLLIPLDEREAQVVSIAVPRLYKAGLNFTKTTDLTLSFVNAFNYNPNTIRQYVSQDNSIMFVGETGSLNLHPDGLVEYKALDAEDGVPLGSEKTLSGITRGLCNFLEKIMRIGGINVANADFSVRPTETPQDFKFDNATRLCFDYYVADKKIEFLDSYGILAVVKNGNLTELKMHLKNIQAEGRESNMPKLLEELDKFRAINPEISEIKNAYGVYRYTEEAEEIEAQWKIEGVR